MKKRGATTPIAWKSTDSQHEREFDVARTSREHDQAVRLACKYRDRLIELLIAELGLVEPKETEYEAADQFSLAACDIGEALAKLIEQHLVRKALRLARERKLNGQKPMDAPTEEEVCP